MNKRRVIAVAILLGTLASPLVFVIAMDLADLSIKPGVTAINFNRVYEGMTLQKVRQLMGDDGEQKSTMEEPQLCDFFVVWRSDEHFVIVGVKDGMVRFKYSDYQENEETTLGKLRRWLHLW
jgi:hypothetical protein